MLLFQINITSGDSGDVVEMLAYNTESTPNEAKIAKEHLQAVRAVVEHCRKTRPIEIVIKEAPREAYAP